jgi:HEAT repeat protein
MRVAVFLRFLPADVVVKALSGFFDDPAESVRKAAAQSAGSLAVDELVDGLVGLLADPSKAVRTAAAAALVATVTPAMRSRVVAQVVARLDDDGVLPADFTALWGMLGVASRA